MFGAKGDVRDNADYLDETTVLYAAGNQIVLHHVESNTQRFIPGAPDGEGITALALSPNRKFLAIAERGEKATISVLDLTTHAKRRKVLASAEVNAKVRPIGWQWHHEERLIPLFSLCENQHRAHSDEDGQTNNPLTTHYLFSFQTPYRNTLPSLSPLTAVTSSRKALRRIGTSRFGSGKS